MQIKHIRPPLGRSLIRGPPTGPRPCPPRKPSPTIPLPPPQQDPRASPKAKNLSPQYIPAHHNRNENATDSECPKRGVHTIGESAERPPGLKVGRPARLVPSPHAYRPAVFTFNRQFVPCPSPSPPFRLNAPARRKAPLYFRAST